MRQQLQNFEEYFWGLSTDDFAATRDLVKTFMNSYGKELDVLKDKEMPAHEYDLYVAQHYREAQFLLQFGIWRLQGIFEGLLISDFQVNGITNLWKILEALKKQGYIILKEGELREWTRLRNKLTHEATERLHPCPTNLIEQDIDEFAQLLLDIYSDLDKQKRLKAQTN